MFGADNAKVTAAATDVSADGTTITLTVPLYAITQPLTITTPTGVPATL
jgi:hypothetical protein